MLIVSAPNKCSKRRKFRNERLFMKLSYLWSAFISCAEAKSLCYLLMRQLHTFLHMLIIVCCLIPMCIWKLLISPVFLYLIFNNKFPCSKSIISFNYSTNQFETNNFKLFRRFFFFFLLLLLFPYIQFIHQSFIHSESC